MRYIHKIQEQTNKLEIELKRLDEGLLNETQRIQISISEIAKSIEKDNYASLREIMYKTITIRPDFKQELDRVYGANPQIREPYEKLGLQADAESPKWVSWIINTGSGRFKGDNYKLYYSLKPDDITVFVQNFFKLVEMLRAATQNSEDNIKIKIPDNSTVFIAENDNIVIHFKDKTAKDKYDAVVKKWASQYGITLGQRTHSFGQDTKANSYGYRLADVFVQYAKDLKTKGHTPERIAQWIGENFTTIINRVKIP